MVLRAIPFLLACVVILVILVLLADASLRLLIVYGLVAAALVATGSGGSTCSANARS